MLTKQERELLTLLSNKLSNDKDDKKLITILAKRDGQHTLVELDNGLTLDV